MKTLTTVLILFFSVRIMAQNLSNDAVGTWQSVSSGCGTTFSDEEISHFSSKGADNFSSIRILKLTEDTYRISSHNGKGCENRAPGEYHNIPEANGRPLFCKASMIYTEGAYTSSDDTTAVFTFENMTGINGFEESLGIRYKYVRFEIIHDVLVFKQPNVAGCMSNEYFYTYFIPAPMF